MKRLLLAVVPLLGFMAVGLGTAPPAAAQSGDDSEIVTVEVAARVNPDGSMDVVEELQYDWPGEQNGGTRTIPSGDYSIVDFRVTEDGESRDLAAPYDDPNGGQVRWYGSGDHSKVTGEHHYELRYRVLDAVDVHPDVAELEWQFIGSGFPSLERVSVTVSMPGDGTDLRAFAHGDLRGIVEPVGNTVLLRVFDNPEGSLVEARILVPAELFTVAPSGPPALERILAEEGALADEANAARADANDAFHDEVERGMEPGCDDESSARLDRLCDRLEELLDDGEERLENDVLSLEDAEIYFDILQVRREIEDEVDRIVDARNARIGNIAAPIIAAICFVGWFAVWRRWGKEPDQPHDIGDYWREVPPESPAVVGAIDDWGVIDSKAFAATLIDLAQRGWLTITEEEDGHRFTRTQQTTDELPLRDYESKALWKLFDGGRATVTQDELVDEAKAARTSSAEWMSSFKAQVKADYDAQQYQAKHGCLPWLLWVVLVLVCGGTAALAFLMTAWVGGGIAAGTTLVILVLGVLIRRRTEKGARKHAEISGLKAFLRDFSLVDDVPVGHLALYERYLVYAVALGVADKLIAGLRIRFPELADPDRGFATWYVYGLAVSHGGGGGFDKLGSLGSVGSFANDFSQATASAFSPPSSSSGGGGGFSGGGGGGGGGGGAGSW